MYRCIAIINYCIIQHYPYIIFYLKHLDINEAAIKFQSKQERTISQLINNTDLRTSIRKPVHLTCGYKGIPVLNSTIITWYQNNQLLGVFKPPKLINTVNPSYNLTSYFTDGVGLTISFFPGYSQYRCNITNIGQEISMSVNVVAQSDYQLQIMAPYTATENKQFLLECVATFTLGRPSNADHFVWYRIDHRPQRLAG